MNFSDRIEINLNNGGIVRQRPQRLSDQIDDYRKPQCYLRCRKNIGLLVQIALGIGIQRAKKRHSSNFGNPEPVFIAESDASIVLP